MRRAVMCAMGLGLALGLTGCGGADTSSRSPAPNPSATGAPLGSLAAFQAFSGVALPATAKDVSIMVTTKLGSPAYRVKFHLPSNQVDKLCEDGQLGRPLRITTISPDIRETFDYTGDSSTGVAFAEASLPSNVLIQRQVLAVGIKKPTADVAVYAYRMPN